VQTEKKQTYLKKFTRSIQEEFLKVSKQVARLVKEEFEQRSLAELKIKELAAKLKYHKINEYFRDNRIRDHRNIENI
jgi:hypothetical protein